MANSKRILKKNKSLSTGQLVLFALVFAAIGGIISYSAFAAPAKGGKGTIAMKLVTDNNGDGKPSFGDVVSYDVTTTSTSFPWVNTKCTQNGTTVYEQWAGFYDSYNGGKNFTLGPTQSWSGGPASCTASLASFDKSGRPQMLSSINFDTN